MAKVSGSVTNKSEAFEIIELAIDDIDTLTRAFNLISQVCEEYGTPCATIETCPPKAVLN